MKNLLLCLLVFSSIFFPDSKIYAQGENNIWAFGDSQGVDFNSGAPLLISTNIKSTESCGAICNAEGRLLFYCGNPDMISNGIWDATHNLMPNGTGLLGNKYGTTMQGIAVVPFLDGTNRYYVFIQSGAPEIATGDYYLRYSVVDMDLRGGLGDVVSGQKNIILDSLITEKMALSVGENCSVWLLSHRLDTSSFHAFKIDASGVHTSPVISSFPSDHFTVFTSPFISGTMEISINGNRLVSSCAGGYDHFIEMFDFDKSTGRLSNQKIIDSVFSPWVQLSPDGNKLYTSPLLSQYNLSLLPSISAVKASRYKLSDTVYFTSMRIGPDKNIYSSCGFDRPTGIELYIYQISNPNLTAPGCGLNRILKLKDKVHVLGLGIRNIIPPPSDTITRKKDTLVCFSPYAAIIADSGFNAYIWNDGTIGRVLTVKASGKSWVTMRKGCSLFVDTFEYHAATLDSTKFITDTSLCFTKSFTENVKVPNFNKWFDGDTSKSRTFSTGGVYWYSSFPADCTIRIDSLRVKFFGYDTTQVTRKLSICPGVNLTMDASSGYDTHLWYDGSAGEHNTTIYPGKYWVVSIRDCSLHIDSFIVEAQNTNFSYFTHDTTLCFESEYTVTAPTGYTNYLWSDGSIDQSNSFTKDGSKWVLSSNTDCTARIDTFNVKLIHFTNNLKMLDSFCMGELLLLDATTDLASKYQWQDGNENPIYEVTKSGVYRVTISLGACIQTQSVTVKEKSLSVDIGPDQKICDGEEMLLQAIENMTSYKWSDGSTLSTLRVDKAGIYSVVVKNDFCEASDTIVITTVACSNCIHIPNTFTPNADGKNDFFKPIVRCNVENYEFKVFNRYGQEVFKTKNVSESWDGSFLGNNLDVGVYFYLVRVRFDVPDAAWELYKGDINLVH